MEFRLPLTSNLGASWLRGINPSTIMRGIRDQHVQRDHEFAVGELQFSFFLSLFVQRRALEPRPPTFHAAPIHASHNPQSPQSSRPSPSCARVEVAVRKAQARKRLRASPPPAAGAATAHYGCTSHLPPNSCSHSSRLASSYSTISTALPAEINAPSGTPSTGIRWMPKFL